MLLPALVRFSTFSSSADAGAAIDSSLFDARIRQVCAYALGVFAERRPSHFFQGCGGAAGPSLAALITLAQREGRVAPASASGDDDDEEDEEDEEELSLVKENAVSSIGKLLRSAHTARASGAISPAAADAFASSQALGGKFGATFDQLTATVLPMWLGCLPLREDEMEAKATHRALLEWCSEGSPALLGGAGMANVPKVLSVFSQCLLQQAGGEGGGDDEGDDDEIELASNGTKEGIRAFVGASLREGRGVPSPVMQSALQQLDPRAREALMTSATA